MKFILKYVCSSVFLSVPVLVVSMLIAPQAISSVNFGNNLNAYITDHDTISDTYSVSDGKSTWTGVHSTQLNDRQIQGYRASLITGASMKNAALAIQADLQLTGDKLKNLALAQQSATINVNIKTLNPTDKVSVKINNVAYTTEAGELMKLRPNLQVSVPFNSVIINSSSQNNGHGKTERNRHSGQPGRGGDNAHSHAFGGHGYGHDNSRTEGFGGHAHFH